MTKVRCSRSRLDATAPAEVPYPTSLGWASKCAMQARKLKIAAVAHLQRSAAAFAHSSASSTCRIRFEAESGHGQPR